MTPTVATSFAIGLVDFAAQRGADREALLAAARIDRAALAERDARFDVESYRRLFAAAQNALADPLLPFRYGLEVDLRELSLVALIGETGLTPNSALAEFNRYSALLIDAPVDGECRLAIEHHGDELWLVDRLQLPQFPAISETAFARMVGAARKAGLQSPFRRIELAHSPVVDPALVAALLGIEVRFDQKRNAALLDPAMLLARWSGPPSYIGKLVRDHADRLLVEFDGAKGASGDFQRAARTLERSGERVTLNRIAAQLGVSRQTLFRRLREEGMSPSRQMNQLKLDQANAALASGKPIAGIAFDLGYSDRAAFSRAYKRWSGVSPAASRQKINQASLPSTANQ